MKTGLKINETLLASIVAFIALIGFLIWAESSQILQPQRPKDIQITTTTVDISSEFYALTAEERNQMLVKMIYAGEYKVVVSATNDGIENYRDLVWDDLDFWIHRGVALFQLGNCPESGAAFYHVAVRAPENKMASSMIAKITNEGCKTPLDFSQQ